MKNIKIYNQNHEIISEAEVDRTKGYLQERTEIIAHHKAQAAVPAKSHLEVSAVYFTDGSIYHPTGKDDKNIEAIDAEKGIFNFVGATNDSGTLVQGMDIQQVEDSPYIPEKDSWNETETVYDYILYTPEELAAFEKEKQTRLFLETGEQRLIQNEQAVNDLTLSVAEMLGV